MTRKLARALLAIGTLAAVAISTNAEAARYHHRASRHVTAHHFGRYLAYRHFHYHHRHHRVAVVAREEPRFAKRRSNCLFTHGHLDQCIPRETVVYYKKAAYDRGQILPHPAGCPARLFCGCGASIEAFGRSIRDLWSVSSWFRFPRAEPANGMAVIWPGRHVAIIREYLGKGIALLYDANSGHHLTRLHRRSIAGLVVVNPHAGEKRRALVTFEGGVPL